MMIGADHAALEDGKEVFGGVAVDAARTRKLAGSREAWCHARRELAADVPVEAGVVRHKRRSAINIRDERAANVLAWMIGDMERTGATVALD